MGNAARQERDASGGELTTAVADPDHAASAQHHDDLVFIGVHVHRGSRAGRYGRPENAQMAAGMPRVQQDLYSSTIDPLQLFMIAGLGDVGRTHGDPSAPMGGT
ncbi:hypothetical protein GCM10009610_71780 [Pseudonocardia xinjiangensis]